MQWLISPWRVAERFNFKETAKSAKAQPVSWILLLYFLFVTFLNDGRKQRCYLTYAANHPPPLPVMPCKKSSLWLKCTYFCQSPASLLPPLGWGGCQSRTGGGWGWGQCFTFTTLVVHWFSRFDQMWEMWERVILCFYIFSIVCCSFYIVFVYQVPTTLNQIPSKYETNLTMNTLVILILTVFCKSALW